MLSRIFPRQLDNNFAGHRAALWLLGLYLALKLVMSLNSIFNPASVAAGADGIPLDSFGPPAAREVLILFALVALGQLALALIALLALVRYRAMAPLMFLLLLGEGLARRVIVQSQAIPGAASSAVGLAINLGLLGLLALGLGLSLFAREAPKS